MSQNRTNNRSLETRMKLGRLSSSLFLLTLCSFTACDDSALDATSEGSDETEDDESLEQLVGEDEFRLHLYSDDPRWPFDDVLNTVRIHACFNPLETVVFNGVEFDQILMQNDMEHVRDRIRQVVSDEWGRVSNISIHGWDVCPTEHQVDQIRISFVPGRSKHTGNNRVLEGKSSIIVYTGGVDTPNESRTLDRRIILHEFGHTLGFTHEHITDEDGTCRDPNWADDSLQTGGDAHMSVMSYCTSGLVDELSPRDISGVQNAYGRKHSGALVGLNGLCIDIPGSSGSNNEDLKLAPCYDRDDQRWRRNGRYLFAGPGAGSSLRMAIEVGSDGVYDIDDDLQVESSSGGARQRWHMDDVQLIGIGGKCLDLENGGANVGRDIELQDCERYIESGETHKQNRNHWKIEELGLQAHDDGMTVRTFRVVSKDDESLCISSPSSPVHNLDLDLRPCDLEDTFQTWVFVEGEDGRRIHPWDDLDLCWNTEGVGPDDGKDLEVEFCDAIAAPGEVDTADKQQSFHYRGLIHSDVTSSDGELCISANVGSGDDWRSGNRVEVDVCDWQPTMLWDYYPSPYFP